MSKQNFIKRYYLILKKLERNDFPTLNEIREYIEKNSEYKYYADEKSGLDVTVRTIQRDFKEIENNFGLSIVYSKTERGYKLEENVDYQKYTKRLFELFETSHAIKIAKASPEIVDIEVETPLGTHYMIDFLFAIKYKRITNFTYHFFDINQIYSVTCEPIGIKEFKNRWYLLANDKKDKTIKTFAFERISKLEITDKIFFDNKEFNIKKYFENSFGIHTHLDEKPVKIILEFTERQALYVKSKPLHHSQKIISEKNGILTVSLCIQNTYDFRMELLSYGKNVKVIEPKLLKNMLLDEYKKIIEKYQ